MGIEPFLVGSALDCVLAQRLARRLCDKCKEAYTPDAEVARARSAIPGRRASRCRRCTARSAARRAPRPATEGRLALHEVMAVTEEIERLTVERASAAVIGTIAREQGMLTLRDDGMVKVGQGDHLDRGDPARRRLTRGSTPEAGASNGRCRRQRDPSALRYAMRGTFVEAQGMRRLIRRPSR